MKFPSLTSRTVRPEVRHRMIVASMISGPVALVLVLLMVLWVAAIPRDTTRIDFAHEQSEYNNAQNWGRDYLLLWLAGSSKQIATLAAMTSAPGELKLPSTPYAVQDIRNGTVIATPAGPETVWTLSYEALVVAPGSSGVQRLPFEFTAVQHENSYQVTVLPRPTSRTTTPFKVASIYNSGIDVNSALGSGAKAFITTYLTAGANGSLSGVTSSSFRGVPLSKTIFSTVSVLSVLSTKAPFQPASGDKVSVLVTVQGNSTSDTFSIMQFPLRMVFSDQGQWVVDSIEEIIDFGPVTVG